METAILLISIYALSGALLVGRIISRNSGTRQARSEKLKTIFKNERL